MRGRAGGQQAIQWLERAARLAPNDPRIALELAQARLNSGTAANVTEAATAYAQLAEKHEALPAWLGLAMARHRLGDAAGAAAALESLLARHYIPEEPGFAELAHNIAIAAGRPLGGNGPVITRTEGVVAPAKSGLIGWATCRVAPRTPPQLKLHDATGAQRTVKFGRVLPADDDSPLLERHSFRISHRQLHGLTPPFHLITADGGELMGSPVDPAILQLPPTPARRRGRPPAEPPAPRPFCVIIPVFRGLRETQDCLHALQSALAPGTPCIVVDDATPEPALAAWLDAQAAAGRFTLLRHAQNRGFPAAVNTGLAAAHSRDVLLLNSDTLVPARAVETLRRVAYARADTGSVTPLSNAASILSYPNRRGGNAAPDLPGTERLNVLAHAANGDRSVEIPTGVGFCMYLRHDCLEATGGFRAEVFAQGYGEENDWCLRARHLGFAPRAAPGAYVAHLGGVSFGAAAQALMGRNLALLNALYPGYHALVMAHIAADPLRPARARIDALRLRASHSGQEAVLLVSHNHGGGVARQVARHMAALRAQNLRPLLLTTQFPENPTRTPYPWPACLSEGAPDDTTNLTFNLAQDEPALLALLHDLRVSSVALHHSLGHHPGVRGLAARLTVPMDIFIHDYGAFCPRVNLLAPEDKATPARYCGEPDLSACTACCARARAGIPENLSPRALLARSAREFATARSVIAPSADAARRINRHFPGIKPAITPWEDDLIPSSLRPPADGPRRVVIIGGISAAKGLEPLIACARDAAQRSLGLEFILIGASADDARLLDAGVFVTGHYAEGQATGLITSFQPDLVFLPSIWPETWCFALSEAWRAGLYAIAFNLGAQAERIHATGRGATLPLGLPAARVNDFLLSWSPAPP